MKLARICCLAALAIAAPAHAQNMKESGQAAESGPSVSDGAASTTGVIKNDMERQWSTHPQIGTTGEDADGANPPIKTTKER